MYKRTFDKEVEDLLVPILRRNVNQPVAVDRVLKLDRFSVELVLQLGGLFRV